MAPAARLLQLLLIGLLTVLVATHPAASQPSAADVAERIQALVEGSFNDKAEAAVALAATGAPRAQPVLEALLDGSLQMRQTDGRVVIVETRGRQSVMHDALTGATIGPAARGDTQRIRINNRVRVAIRTALASLTLLSETPERRRRAAREMFGTTDTELAPMLESAIEVEQVARVRAAMTRALAGLHALSGGFDEEVRLAGIAALAGFPDPEVRSLLLRVMAQNAGSALEAAAAEVVTEIDQRLAFYRVLGNLFQGISLGSVLLLAAIGLAITFGVMGVINMAHGEMVMLGAYTTFMVQEVFRTHFPEALDYSLFVAIPAAFLVAGAFGVALERSVIRFLYGRPLETLLATWGLSLILQQLVRSVFGATNREVSSPSWMSGTIEIAGGLALTLNRIWIIVFAVLVFAALLLVIRRTQFGLQMRAVTQNRQMANAVGIRSRWVDAMTFGLGSAIAGLGGVALSQIDNVSPNLGQSYIIDSFLVVVFGGVGNLWGTLVAALSLGVVNKFLEPYTGAVLAKIAVLVVVILFIQKRPRGLFALKGRAVEA